MTSCRLFSLFQHSIAFISIEGNPKIGGFSCTSVLLESDSGWTRQQSSNTKTGGQRLRVSSEKMPLSVQRLFTFLTCHGSYKDSSVITIKLITIYDNEITVTIIIIGPVLQLVLQNTNSYLNQKMGLRCNANHWKHVILNRFKTRKVKRASNWNHNLVLVFILVVWSNYFDG